LDRLQPTVTGLDDLPAWFLRLGASVFAKPLAGLFNLSILASIVLKQWKQAQIRPVPKINKPHQPADFRPISITAVLARILERMVVSSYIYPSLILPSPTLIFADQYAFRPTGSTATAIISIMHHVTHLLAGNPYVIVIAIDFTEAFDTVRYAALVDKLATPQLPDNVCNWLGDFFAQRTHCTAYGGEKSSNLEIMASIWRRKIIQPRNNGQHHSGVGCRPCSVRCYRG
jgi:Reverse transcriptase (RNA-dependent DNA polymerase)